MMTKYPLPHTIVGIDVETTSLDPTQGDIIEIAAIRYDLSRPKGAYLGREVAEFVRLTKPRQPLTAQITAITGITNEMLQNARPFQDFAAELQDFIGQDLVFAHNATFDIDYLRQHGITFNQPVWDTFVISGIAWPEAPSYNLGTLAAQLNITVEGEHRAGDDVRLTWELLNRTRAELVLKPTFYAFIPELFTKSQQEHYIALFSSSGKEEKEKNNSLTKKKPAKKLIQNAAEILSPRGTLERQKTGFKHRHEQLEMAQAVEQTIKEGDISFIEAGTGTGKTFAYLIPLIKAASDQPPSIVSTHTKNLQDQLIKHDIPELVQALDISLTSAVLKGRRNYLCFTRLLQALHRGQVKAKEAFLLAKVLNWLDKGGSGDLEQFNTSHQDVHLLQHLHADALSCRVVCPKEQPDCPYQRARRAAQEADLVVVNHALLAQLAGDDRALPVTNLVIDEAHHLEAAAREVSRRDFSDHRVAELIAPFVQLGKEGNNTQHVHTEAQECIAEYQQLRKSMSEYIKEVAASESLRLTPAVRKSTAWQKIVNEGAAWQGRLQFLIGLVQGISLTHEQAEIMHEATLEASQFSRYLQEFLHGDAERIQWLEYHEPYTPGNPTLIIQDVALSSLSQLMPLYDQARSITLTSATMTTESTFSYIKSRIGLENAKEVKLGSPFNYQQQMLIYIIDDAPHPSSAEFDVFTAKILIKVSQKVSGRTLGLFTSHRSVKEVYFHSIKKINQLGFTLLAQRMSGGRHNIIARFKKHPGTVLIGTNSFWEGIDVPGESLSVILIPRLPFAPPHDPINDAIAEAGGLNPFTQASLPRMILRLRQGIGRLIRSVDDHGVVIIADGRFLKQEYGKKVLDSLPPATIHIGSYHDLEERMTEWFGEQKINEWQQEKNAKKS